MEYGARAIHHQAEQARETGDFVEALELTDQATIAYQEEGNLAGFAEIQASRFLTLRHLFEETGHRGFLILAKYAAMASVELAQESDAKEALAIPLFNLAKAQETLGELPEAVKSYQEALDNLTNNPPPTHSRPAVIGDFKVHLATCEYKAGDKSALGRAEAALTELKSVDEISQYNKDVWVSGGHMRIAEMLREDDPQKAREHLGLAKTVIDANPDLKLRLKQWEKLAETFK